MFFMENRKQFFQERNPSEIKKLNIHYGYTNRDLIQRIDELDPDEDALEIRTLIIPQKFRMKNSSSEASRKCYKHGSLIILPQPSGLEECYKSSYIPLNFRAEAFANLSRMKQIDINYVGYSFRPVFGRDRIKRVVPFVNVVEGTRIFSYAENYSKFRQKDKFNKIVVEKKGIRVDAYPDANRVLKEGASVVVHVPSRTEKKQKYVFGLNHIPYVPNPPIEGNNYGLSVSLALSPFLVVDEENFVESRTVHDKYDIRYTSSNSSETSKVIRFTPQDVAGYLGVIKRQLHEEDNITALTFNPFSLPSKHQAEFYIKLCNNVLIYDSDLSDKNKLRKLHLAEKSILLARAIGFFGHDNFSFWNPVRDGIYKNFEW